MSQSSPITTSTLQDLDRTLATSEQIGYSFPRQDIRQPPSTTTGTMTSHPNMYSWSTEIPPLLTEDFASHSPLQPFWQWAYEPSGHEPQSEESAASSPDSSYQQGSLEMPFCHPDDYLDLSRFGTPSSGLEDSQDTTQVSIDTASTGANKRMRRREQNRASQRAYRDRQRGKIAELQSKVIALKAQNEKLQARNEMLEATFQQGKNQITSAPALQRNASNEASAKPSTSSIILKGRSTFST